VARLFRWLIRQRGLLRVNPAEGVRAPKSPQRLPKVLSPDQASALLDAEPDDRLEVRDRAMFELFYSSGLRLAELVGLNVGEGLDLVEGLVTVRGKRGKLRTVPVGSHAVQALQAWLVQRGARDPGTGDGRALFITRSGGRMSPSAIRSRLARWAKIHGFGVHVHPHMLRHSFASHLLQSSGDLRAVRSSSATPASAARRSIPISIFSISRRCTTQRTRAQKKADSRPITPAADHPKRVAGRKRASP